MKEDLVMENFITVLLKNREENDVFNVEDSELEEWENKLEQTKKELYTLVNDTLDEKKQNRHDHLLIEMEEIEKNIFDLKKQLYFEIGIKEGAKIAEVLKSK